MILEGEYHYKTRSFLTSLFGKKILPIAVDDEFINMNIDKPDIKKRCNIYN